MQAADKVSHWEKFLTYSWEVIKGCLFPEASSVESDFWMPAFLIGTPCLAEYNFHSHLKAKNLSEIHKHFTYS